MSLTLSPDPFEAARELAAFEAARRAEDLETGGIVSFSGLVRADGGKVTGLELEAYAGFAEREILSMAEACASTHDLLAWRIRHRIGLIAPGETVVFVAAAARHRRDAFLAADQMMDYLKASAPFWKKSHEQDGARWVEPREQDYIDASRWDRPQETTT